MYIYIYLYIYIYIYIVPYIVLYAPVYQTSLLLAPTLRCYGSQICSTPHTHIANVLK